MNEVRTELPLASSGGGFWALHLVALPGEEKTLVELTVAPERRAIDIRLHDARRADLR